MNVKNLNNLPESFLIPFILSSGSSCLCRVSDWGFDTGLIQGLGSHGPEACSCKTIDRQDKTARITLFLSLNSPGEFLLHWNSYGFFDIKVREVV